MSVRDDIAFLVGSPCRIEILRVLSETEMRPTALAGECSCARETAQRNLAEFRDRGWVEKPGKRYRLTPTGSIVLDAYEEMHATARCAAELRPFLSNVDDHVCSLSPRLLASQNVTTATSGTPHAPINRYLSLVGTDPVDTFRGMTPIVSRVYNEAAEQIIGPDTEMELIVDTDVLRASKREYPQALERAFEIDQFELLLAPGSIECGLTLVDGHAYLVAHDDQGNAVASVDGDADEFVDRVESVYEDRREEARPVEDAGDVSALCEDEPSGHV